MSRKRRNRKKEPRRRQDVEKRKEDKNEDIQRARPSPTQAEQLAHYFKSDELVELRNIVQSSDMSNIPLLLAAVMLGKFNVVKRLFKEGAPIDSRGPEQATPLMWAVKHKNMEMIDLLIKRGAKITPVDDRGDNAILLALQTPAWDQDSFLDFWNSVKECESFNLNYANKLGYTMLHYATKNQWENVLNYLLSQGANVNCVTSKGVTPLMMAASRNHSQFVRTLLQAKADVSIEDERCCTALCYTIAFISQKHLELPNPTLEGLMSAIEKKKSKFSFEMYIKRRLDVILKPPEMASNNADMVFSIMYSIIVFFLRRTETGLELLLEQEVFSKLTEAIEAHLGDPDYTHALLGLIMELLRYCPCCYGGGNCSISEDEIMEVFVGSGGANVCLSVLKRYNLLSNKCLFIAALMPLLSACPSEGKGQAWLEDNYHEIVPYYSNFLDVRLVQFNINADKYHLALLRKKKKKFLKLMYRLERGESIVTKEKSKSPSRNYEQELSVSGQDCFGQEQVNSAIPSEITTKQYNLANVEVNSVCGSEDFITDQEAVFSEPECCISEHNTSNMEQDHIAEQETFYFDIHGHFCSISSSQNSIVSTNSLDNISEQEATITHPVINPLKILPEMSKVWENKKSKMQNTEISILQHECKLSNSYQSPNFIPLDILQNESNSSSICSKHTINTKYSEKYDDVLEEEEIFNSCFSTKVGSIDDKHIDHIISSKKTDFVSDIPIVYTTIHSLNDANISRNVRESEDDIVIHKENLTEKKEISMLFKDFDSENGNTLSSQPDPILPTNFQEKSCVLIPESEYKENQMLQFITSESEEEKCKVTETIIALDNLFKKLLIKYVKSWQNEFDHNYPGFFGGGDGFDVYQGTNENFLKLKSFLSKLEKDYIIYLKSVWESFKEKLKETKDPDICKDISCQVIELIRRHDKKLDSKMKRIDEILQKQMNSENDYDVTVSRLDSKETLSSVHRTLSTAGSDDLSDEMKNFINKFSDIGDCNEYSFQQCSLKDTNFPFNVDDNLNDSTVQCWESVLKNEDIIYDCQNFDIPDVSIQSNSKLTEDSNSKLDNIKVLQMLGTNSKVKESFHMCAEGKIMHDIINQQPVLNAKSDKEHQTKKLSFAELFKDSSVTNSQETIMNSIVSIQQSQAVPTAFASATNNDVGANAAGRRIQYVPPPPGFPAHPLSLKSVLRTRAETNDCHALLPTLPVYMNLPEAMSCPEKVAIFMSGRSMGTSSSPMDITQVAPLVMIPGLPNYVSRWKFLIGILHNVSPMYNHWFLDGKGMKRIALFDSPIKLPGGGNFGEVFFALGDNKYPLAAKVLNMNLTNGSSTIGVLLLKMIAPLMKLKHEHLLNYIYCGRHECRLFLISTLCECNLGEYLMCLKVHRKLECRSSELVKQLTLGVKFLHTLPNPIIHGNLKPSNVLLDDRGTIKLTDFGLHPILYQINDAPNSSVIWWARETHDAFKESSNFFCTLKSDIQVTGMLIHFIVTGGLHPFGAEASEIIENVTIGKPKYKITSCEANDLISWMTLFEPESRPSALDTMNHVFFWDEARKWKFVLGCCGIDCFGQALPLPISEFHSTLDLKAMEEDVKGDWVSLLKAAFCEVSFDDYGSDTLTGLLKFIRICMEKQKEKKLVNGPPNLHNFFLSTFPALVLSLFRLIEETEWRKHPVIENLMKGN